MENDISKKVLFMWRRVKEIEHALYEIGRSAKTDNEEIMRVCTAIKELHVRREEVERLIKS